MAKSPEFINFSIHQIYKVRTLVSLVSCGNRSQNADFIKTASILTCISFLFARKWTRKFLSIFFGENYENHLFEKFVFPLFNFCSEPGFTFRARTTATINPAPTGTGRLHQNQLHKA
jgi:hypothetical protein